MTNPNIDPLIHGAEVDREVVGSMRVVVLAMLINAVVMVSAIVGVTIALA